MTRSQPRQIAKRRPHRGPHDESFNVLVRCFADAIGADSGFLLERRGHVSARVLASWDRNGGEPAPDWAAGGLLPRVYAAREPLLGTPSGWLDAERRASWTRAVAAPVRTQARVLGALYGGFAGPSEIEQAQLRWLAASFARAAALCMTGTGSLGTAIASSNVDALTGCLNYSALVELLGAEVQRSARHGHRLCCGFMDLDGFKALNDSRGHLDGNRVLSAVGAALVASARRYDAVARFGGDEFVFVLPETSGRAAVDMAGRLRADVRAATSSAGDAPVDVSIGVAEWTAGDSAGDLLELADEALREAKEAGGGQIATRIPPERRFDGLTELTRALLPGRADAQESAEKEGSANGRFGRRTGRAPQPAKRPSAG